MTGDTMTIAATVSTNAAPPQVGPALLLEGVSRHYLRGAERVVALDAVDLTLAAGESVAVTGPSGSGKSTLLHVAGGLDQPDAGRVVVGGVDLAAAGGTERARLRRRHVGFVFQSFHLLPGLSVAENVALPLKLDGAPSTDAVAEVLVRVGLTARADHRPAELSGGEMQRAAVARAVVTRPALVLADEPTGNLDSANGAAVLDLLLEQVAAVAAALVVVTHDDRVAVRTDRVLALQDGRVCS
ncbi:MAG: abc30a [Acidimicrobiales bacterium]|jgi:ABC-type lipoprotein export system ATPase subunit|nr:abc30a [Acidimicrobiales bacterium]